MFHKMDKNMYKCIFVILIVISSHNYMCFSSNVKENNQWNESYHVEVLKNAVTSKNTDLSSSIFESYNKFINGTAIITLLEGFLKQQEISLQKIHEQVSADGDIIKLVDIINNSTKYNILKITDEKIRFIPSQLIKLIQSNIGKVIRHIFPDNYVLQIILQNSINKEIRAHSGQFIQDLESHSISISTLKQILHENNHIRQKRDISGDNIILKSFIDVILNIVKSELSKIIVSIKNSTDQALTNVVNIILSFYISSQPESVFQDFVANVTNVSIQELVRIISVFQKQIDEVLSHVIQQGQISMRKKRETSVHELINENRLDNNATVLLHLNDHLNETNVLQKNEVSVTSSPSITSILLAPFKLIIKIIVTVFNSIINVVTNPLQPIMLVINQIVKVIQAIFYGILDPVNTGLKRIVISIFNKSEEILSSLLIKPIEQSILDFIDSIIPCKQNCSVDI